MTTGEVKDTAVEPESGAAILARIKPVRRRGETFLCLRPDLLDEWTELQAELAEDAAGDMTKTRLAAGVAKATSAATKAKARRVKELEAQIAETQVKFVMDSLPSDQFEQLKVRNPPRADNQIDQLVGYNRGAVEAYGVKLAILEPVFHDCDKDGCLHVDCGSWQQLVALLNISEWEELVNLFREVNGAQVAPPFSELADRILESSRGSRSRGRTA